MRNLIFLLPLLALFVKCSTPYQSEIKEIDSLLVVLDSAKFILNQVDYEVLLETKAHGEAKFIRLNELVDTVGKKEAILLDQYGALLKAYRKWGEKYPAFEEYVEVIPMQLKNLKKDLSNNLLDPDEAIIYLENESIATMSIYESINQMYSGLNSIEESFQQYDEKVLHLIQRLELDQKEEIEI